MIRIPRSFLAVPFLSVTVLPAQEVQWWQKDFASALVAANDSKAKMVLLYCFRDKHANCESMWANTLSEKSVHTLLVEVLQRAILLRQEVPPSDIILTDDRSPIEWITNNMVLNYVFFGDMESLR